MNIYTSVKSFICTVEEGSFTAAAAKLNVSKSLVSRNIKDLENYLSVHLMNRSTKTLSLTNAGKQYYEEASVLVARFESLNDSIRIDSESISGHLNVLAPKGLSEVIFIPFVLEFTSRYPDIKLNLRLHDELYDLSEVGYDVAIRSGSLVRQDLDLIAITILEHHNIICASPEYLRTRPKINKPLDLLEHRLIEDPNLKVNGSWEFVLGEHCQRLDVVPAITVNSIQAVRRLLLANYGVAMIPQLLVRDKLERGELVHLLPEYELQKRGVYALYPDRQNTPKKVKLFIHELKAFFAN